MIETWIFVFVLVFYFTIAMISVLGWTNAARVNKLQQEALNKLLEEKKKLVAEYQRQKSLVDFYRTQKEMVNKK